MKIRNRQSDALPSEITLAQFGQAMRQLDLSTVAPNKRKTAVFDHLMTVMADNVADPQARFEILMSQRLRRALDD